MGYRWVGLSAISDLTQLEGLVDGSQRQALEETLRSQPELFALVAGGILVVAVLVLFYRRRRPAGKKFQEVLGECEEITVLTHPNPDPDAMASAMGVALLANQVDTEPTIQYTGQIRHQENRAFQTVLDVNLERVEHVTDLATEEVVLVDHNKPRGFQGADGVLPLAVVDHHPGEGVGAEFTDVRTDYGACSSMVAEYFQDVNATPVPPDQHASEAGTRRTVSTETSTGLLYGILADTSHLTVGASTADFEAAGYLRPGVDEDLLDRIANPAVDAEVLDVKARAIAGRQVNGSFAVADVGAITNADAIAQAADELILLEGITAVVVWGERDGTLHLSGRSRDDRVHMGQTLQMALEEIPNASAGGHARMGGGQIPPEPVTDGDTPSVQYRDGLVDRMFSAMAGDV
ncbi:nanoRNase/pAp phosphatase [Halalkaliarchaeum sp. AArc-CO]|uniref:DHH family phosphoesterase n=1 Tax=Halalkaliarchaeum sp. AArc-CO TaxID=2866381 RepID=UPI00217E6456|nr:bifunctional oligoribonuclease/PAP phosphatase NrnA [Halalkaliarchaeum sp. AArc-CO]UWG49744.1 nanoRNase/pAp phosphatase [Halalkaliarchaeum sp. AArc-CO]